MKITTDFESGNGKNIQKIDKNFFSLETEGEGESYASYFCLKIENEKGLPEKCQLDIKLDSNIKYTEEHRKSHKKAIYPFWISKDGNNWDKFTKHVCTDLGWRVELEINSNGSLILSNMAVLFYSRMIKRIEKEYSKYKGVSLHLIGHSFEGRPLYLLSIGNPKSKRRVLVISGFHGIEFPGIWASKGMIEYLISDEKTAERIKENFVIDIIPYGNPDGTVLGKPRTNAQGIDLHRQANPDKEPVAAEVMAIWRWIEKNPPFLYINLHGWNACEKGKEPFEGALRPPLKIYKKEDLRKKVLECDQSLIERANPISRYDKIVEFGVSFDEESDNLPNLLAKKYTTISYVYEPNMRTGPEGCQEKGVKVLQALIEPFL